MSAADSAVQRSHGPNGTGKAAWPLHTLRADIDFGRVTAHTAYGSLGIKTWVFKGEVLGSGAETASGGKQN